MLMVEAIFKSRVPGPDFRETIMKSGKAWRKRQEQDPYVRRARKDQARSRAVFKLEEIDRRDRLFHPGQLVVDLGAAPGSWSRYAADAVRPGGRVVAVDVLEMAPIPGVEFIQGDFTGAAMFQACLDALDGRNADLVIADLAPNLTGIRATDQARSMHLAELVLDFAGRALKPGGTLLVKVFQGAGLDPYREELKHRFQKLAVRKPGASRTASREFYLLASGYGGS